MKNLLLVLLAVASMSVQANEYAKSESEVLTLNLHMMGKRPYQPFVVKQEQFEGATLQNESIDSKSKTKPNIDHLGKRPYME